MAQAGCEQPAGGPTPRKEQDRRGDDRRTGQAPIDHAERRAGDRRSGEERRAR